VLAPEVLQLTTAPLLDMDATASPVGTAQQVVWKLTGVLAELVTPEQLAEILTS
jgi:hypothetical protein